MNFHLTKMDKFIEDNNLKIGISEDKVKVILCNNIPLTKQISWENKKKIIKNLVTETQEDIEKIYNRCNEFSTDTKLGFFLSVGGNDWIRKDSWESPVLHRYLIKQLSFYFKINEKHANEIYKKILNQNDFSNKKLFRFIKKIYFNFDILITSLLISTINLIIKKDKLSILTLGFIGKKLDDINDLSNKYKFKNYDVNFKPRLKYFSNYLLNSDNKSYFSLNLFDWLKTILISVRYFYFWKKFKNENKSISYFFEYIDNSFIGIFNSLYEYKSFKKLLNHAKVKYVISAATPNRPSNRRLFLASSKIGSKTISINTKVMVYNNLGYRFNFKKYNCDKVGIASKFFVTTHSSKQTLLRAGINVPDINEIYPIEKNKQKEKSKKLLNHRNFIILLCLTPNYKVNFELFNIVKNFSIKQNAEFLVRLHPLLGMDEQIFLSNNNNNYTNVTGMKFEKLRDVFTNHNTPTFAVSNFSSSLCKALHYNFIPVWIRYLGETPILFNEIIDNVGMVADNFDQFAKIMLKYSKMNEFNRQLYLEKRKSFNYIGKDINSNDFENIVSSLT